MPNKITKAIVRGFKSHLNSEFNYAPGLTVVTGPSDAGKSAGVMQPIKWVAFGEPSGEAYLFTTRDPKTCEIVKQAEAAEVELHTDDGIVVLKTRRKGKTAYYIDGKLISEKAEVPEEVKEALGLAKQSYGDFETSLNFAYQLEAPFILSETASVGAKVLGRLAGTEIVDKAIAAISKRTYGARTEKSNAQHTIDTSNVELIEYLQVDDLKQAVEACETILAVLETDMANVEAIGQMAGRYSLISDRLQATNDTLARLSVIHYLGDYLAAIDADQAAYTAIEESYSRYKSLQDILKGIQQRIESLKDVTLASELLNDVENAYNRFTAIQTDFNAFTYYEGQLKVTQANLDRYGHLPEVVNMVQVTDQNYDLLVSVQDLYSTWTGLSDQIKRQEEVIDTCKDLFTAGHLLTMAVIDNDTAYKLAVEWGRLDAINISIDATNEYLGNFTHLEEGKVLLEDIDAKYGEFEALNATLIQYRIAQGFVETASTNLDTIKEQLAQAQAELSAAWQEAGDICPLCEQAVDEAHRH